MRISDWSSDVCSSDLYWPPTGVLSTRHSIPAPRLLHSPSSSFQVPRSSPAVKKRSFIGRPFWPQESMFAAQACMPYITQRGICSQIRSEEHTSELQSLMRISYAVFCLKKKKKNH